MAAVLQTEADVLSSLAFADTRHDFERAHAAAFLTVLQESLPGHISWISGEDQALEIATRLSGNALAPVDITDANALFRELGGSPDTPVAILCDSSFCVHLMYILSNNTVGKVYFIQNREVENDPGNNLNTTNVRPPFDVLRDVNSDNIGYPKYDPTDTSINTKLCSIFDVNMDLETAIYSLNGEFLDSTKYLDGSTKLPNIKRKIGDHDYTYTEIYQDQSIVHTIQCAFLQKRSGDWLQALSCVDRDREYEEPDGTRRNLKNVVTYFCTSDRIPLAYALYLGISCIRKRINRDTKEVSYSYYRNPTDRIAESHTDSMRSHYIETYPSYTTGVSYAETKADILLGIDLYERYSRAFLAELERVREATTLEELRTCLGYAVHYVWLDYAFKSMHRHIEHLRVFLENPLDTRITDDVKWHIVPIFKDLKCAIKSFRDFDIHTPIYDEKFRVFDPTKYFVKFHELQYSVVYGQIILSFLLNQKLPELAAFVQQFINALIPLVDSEVVTTHYALFLERYPGVQAGGGTRQPYDPAHLKLIGQYLLEYLASDEIWPEIIQTRKGTHRFSNGSFRLCSEQLRTIVLGHGIVIDGLLDYIRTSPYPKSLSDISTFLKTGGKKYSWNRNQSRLIRAQTRTPRRRTLRALRRTRRRR
jgi:hypothetical protein